MEIGLEKKFISCFQLLYSSERNIEVSGDIVVPDTKNDIQSIIYANAKYKIRSKDTETGKITIKGELEYSAAYVPADGNGISVLKSELPFEFVFESEDIDSSSFTEAHISVSNVETRMLNPRKIMVSIQLNVKALCYGISDFVWYKQPKEQIKNCFFKQSNHRVDVISLVTEKTFSIEDEAEINNINENTQLVFSDVRFVFDSAEAVGSKLVVKGHANANIILANNDRLETVSKTVSYSQIFELPERDITPIFGAEILPTGDYFELSEGKISFEAHAVIQIYCKQECDIEYLEDAYACGKKLSSIKAEKSIDFNTKVISLQEKTKLTGTSSAEISEILLSEVQTVNPKIIDENIIVPLSASVVYSDASGKLYMSKMNGSIKADISEMKTNSIEKTEVIIENKKSNYNGNEISVSVSASINIMLTERKTLSIISEISLDELEDKKPAPSAYLVSTDNSDLWSLAKKYSSSVEAIAKYNVIDADANISEKLLFIPRL